MTVTDRGVVFVNPRSGKDSTSPADLAAHFPDHRVEQTPAHGLADRIRSAVDEGAAFIGTAGGDGTIRSGAEALLGGAVPLLPVPAGTRNHFARQLGIEDFPAAVRAASGRVEAVDVGEVNGHCFINNSAIGSYPEMVERREAFQRRKLPKRLAQVLADVSQLARGDRFNVTIEGVGYRAWTIFVGNGHYGEDMLDLASRQTLNQGVLDVRLVRADRFLARTRVTASLMLGRLHRSPLVVQRVVSEITFEFDTPTVEVALDGEVVTLDAPLRYRSRAGELRVLIQPESEDQPRPPVLRRARPDRPSAPRPGAEPPRGGPRRSVSGGAGPSPPQTRP
ncbi:MAG: NAD(+)/NADH kinase [Actinomycetota bacterium]|nr:NAD(+)/NADH kinase [Actinomycetota bacterium]